MIVKARGREAWAIRAGMAAVALFIGAWAGGAALIFATVWEFFNFYYGAPVLWGGLISHQTILDVRRNLPLGLAVALVVIFHLGAGMLAAFKLVSLTHFDLDWRSFREWRRVVGRSIACGFAMAPKMLAMLVVGGGIFAVGVAVLALDVPEFMFRALPVATVVCIVLVVRILLPLPMLAFLLAERPRLGMAQMLRMYWRLMPHLATMGFFVLGLMVPVGVCVAVHLAWVNGWWLLPGLLGVGAVLIGHWTWQMMASLYLDWRQRLPEFAPLAIAVMIADADDDADEIGDESGDEFAETGGTDRREVLPDDSPIAVGTDADGKPLRGWLWAAVLFGLPMLVAVAVLAFRVWLRLPAPDAAYVAELEAKYPAPEKPAEFSPDWQRIIAYGQEISDADDDRFYTPNLPPADDMLAVWRRALAQPLPAQRFDDRYKWKCIFRFATMRLEATRDDPAEFRTAFADALRLACVDGGASGSAWYTTMGFFADPLNAFAEHLSRHRDTLTIADLAALDAVIADIRARVESPEITEIREWVQNFRAHERGMAIRCDWANHVMVEYAPQTAEDDWQIVSRGVVIEAGLNACRVLEREAHITDAERRAAHTADPQHWRYFAAPVWLHRARVEWHKDRMIRHGWQTETWRNSQFGFADGGLDTINFGHSLRAWLLRMRLFLRVVTAEKLTGEWPANLAALPSLPSELAPVERITDWTPTELANAVIVPLAGEMPATAGDRPTWEKQFGFVLHVANEPARTRFTHHWLQWDY